jgi:hypothetical protein
MLLQRAIQPSDIPAVNMHYRATFSPLIFLKYLFEWPVAFYKLSYVSFLLAAFVR